MKIGGGGVVMVRPDWAVKAAIVAVVISSVLLFPCVSATTNHTVGGSTGWDLSSDLPSWAASTTFFAGDNLVFRYGPTHDVIEVNASDYAACKTVNPIKTYRESETVVQLEKGGATRYFFCGRSNHCVRGLRVAVEVLALPTSPALPPPNPNPNVTTHPPPPPPPQPLSPPPRRQSPPVPPPYPYHNHDLPLPPPPPAGKCGTCSSAGHIHDSCFPILMMFSLFGTHQILNLLAIVNPLLIMIGLRRRH